MDEGEGPRRTPHGKWAAGALVLLAAIAAPPATAEPARSAPGSGAGRVVWGFCSGDGRIDAADLRREAPRLDVVEGPCAGKGGEVSGAPERIDGL